MTSSPLISFVIVCDLKLERAYRAIESIMRWINSVEKEIIVVYCTEKPMLEDDFEITLIKASPNSDLGHLRYLGAKSSRGKWVAYLEEHCEIVGTEYLNGFRNLEKEGHVGIGGVILSEGSNLSRLLALINFFPFNKTLIKPSMNSLPGYNSLYKKEALDNLGDDTSIFGYDQLIVDKLIKADCSIGLSGEMCIKHYFEKRLMDSLKLNYYFNVGYGIERNRQSNLTMLTRVIYLLKILIIPVARTIKTLAAVYKYRKSEMGFVTMNLHNLFLIQVASCLGTLHGFIFGKGSSEVIFKNLELNLDRH